MKKRTIILAMVLFVAVISTKAQETVSATGGQAIGSGGSASYTVGQVVYTTQTGTGGNSVAQGVQQPFEISVVLGIKEAKDINLSVLAYPNPATDYLTVNVKNYQIDNLQYQVYGLDGKLLQTIDAKGATQSRINIQDYPAGNYFVIVLDNNKEIKVFKIIKN